jgi:hypothetical protein
MAGDYIEPNHEHNYFLVGRETKHISEQVITVLKYQCRCGDKKRKASTDLKDKPIE